MYELGALDAEYEVAIESLLVEASRLDHVSNEEWSIDLYQALSGVSIEGGKVDLLTSYIERVYTTLMSLLNSVIKFIKRMWLRISIGVKNDNDRDELIKQLSKNTSVKVKNDKRLKQLVSSNLAYYFLRAEEGSSISKDIDSLLKESASARKDMLNGETLELKLKTDLSIKKISKSFIFSVETNDYDDSAIYLGVNGMKIYVLAKTKNDPKFGSGFRVINAKIDKKPIWNTSDIIDKTISVKGSLLDLKDMMNIGSLYNVLTKGLFDEIEAIKHDMESDRYRMLKEARSTSDGTLDDIKIHNANIKVKSNAARTLVGVSKALMHIGNGLIYDRKMRIRTAREIVKQIGGENE